MRIYNNNMNRAVHNGAMMDFLTNAKMDDDITTQEDINIWNIYIKYPISSKSNIIVHLINL